MIAQFFAAIMDSLPKSCTGASFIDKTSNILIHTKMPRSNEWHKRDNNPGCRLG